MQIATMNLGRVVVSREADRTRLLQKAGATILLVFLPVLVQSCGRKPSTGVFVEPKLRRLVAPDTKFIVGIRLDKIRETPLYKKLNDQTNFQQRLQLLSERTGFDLQKDLSQMLLVSDGTDRLVLAAGRFTPGQIEAKLGELGKRRTKYKDYTLIGDPQGSIVLMNPSVAAAGTQQALHRLIDNSDTYNDLPPELAKQLEELPGAGQIFAVSIGEFPLQTSGDSDTTGMRSMLSNLLGYVRTAQAGIHLADGAEMDATAQCVSEEGARRVRDALKGAIGLARLNTRDDQMQMLKLYDRVEVTQQNSRVHLAAAIPFDLVDPILQQLPRAADRMRGGQF
jgi:hypothetical protein